MTDFNGDYGSKAGPTVTALGTLGRAMARFGLLGSFAECEDFGPTGRIGHQYTHLRRQSSGDK